MSLLTDDVEFIDTHVHPPTAKMMNETFRPFIPELERVFRRSFPILDVSQIADYYRSAGGMAVLLAWDAETATGLPPLTSAEVAAMVGQHPDVFVDSEASIPTKERPPSQACMRRPTSACWASSCTRAPSASLPQIPPIGPYSRLRPNGASWCCRTPESPPSDAAFPVEGHPSPLRPPAPSR